MNRRSFAPHACLLSVLLATAGGAAEGAGNKPLELVDLMKMRQIEDTTIADNGAWIAYSLVPDRGDATLVVQRADGTARHTAARGRGPQLTPDGAWAAARVEVPLAEKEEQRKQGKGKGTGKGENDDDVKPGLVLINTSDGSATQFERVDRFAFSADGRWLVRQHAKPPKGGDAAGEPAPEEAPETPEATAAEPAGEIEGATQPAPGAATTPTRVTPEVTGEPPVSEPSAGEPPTGAPSGDKPADDEKEAGTLLVLRDLATGEEISFADVGAFAVDDVGRYLAYSVQAAGGTGNGVVVRPLDDPAAAPIPVHGADGGSYDALAWSERPTSDLAFIFEPKAETSAPDDAGDAAEASVEDPSGEGTAGEGTAREEEGEEEGNEGEPVTAATAPPDTALFIWRGETRTGSVVTTSSEAPDGWFLPAKNELVFSRDAQRLFFGYRQRSAWKPPEEKDQATPEAGDAEAATPAVDPFDIEGILEDRTVDVWHVDDPLIQSNQRAQWDEEKKRLFRAVYLRPQGIADALAAGRAVLLADTEVRNVEIAENPRAVLGRADVPYLRERTWDGFFFDLYWISLQDGARRLIAERLSEDASISPDGRFVAYYAAPHWYLWDSVSGEARNLTAGLEVAFADEDHDYPRAAPGYGVADWVSDASAVLINDKFDVWSMPTLPPPAAGAEPFRITAGAGRENRIVYRVIDLDPERQGVFATERLLLDGYHDRRKHSGFYRARADRAGVDAALVNDGESLGFVTKARGDERLVFTREGYTRFPDLWTATSNDLTQPARLSDANPEVADHGWGTAELVEWRDLDGRPLEGVLIKPAGYQAGQRYPVLVYFYRFFSQRLHRFNEPAVNHRPSFPLYASHGYAIFLPDIRFEVGRPGLSATKALVPGVQRLIDMGVADPDAIGLHGHSWSGYQTAFVVTQTNIFKAAVAGAPVSNMTSAYGGIRWGTGMARQFQYEKGQSRLGASLWQARDRYIDNSPLFFADRIQTPLLLMHGDEDDAVPWYQSIELYLALRRLGKQAVFLQYRGEPHHPQAYANKLDYSLKMKAFFDHYLKGEPAPDWLARGVPYSGD